MSKRECNSRGKGNYSKTDRKLHNRERNVLINEAQHDRKYTKRHKNLKSVFFCRSSFRFLSSFLVSPLRPTHNFTF